MQYYRLAAVALILGLSGISGCQTTPSVPLKPYAQIAPHETRSEQQLLRSHGPECGVYYTSAFVPDAISEIFNYAWSKPHLAIKTFENRICGLDNWRPASTRMAKASSLKRTYDYRLVTLVCNAYYRVRQFGKAALCLDYYREYYFDSIEQVDIRDPESIKAGYYMIQASIDNTLGNYVRAQQRVLEAERYLTSKLGNAYASEDPHTDTLLMRGYADGAIASVQLGEREAAYRFLSYLSKFETAAVLDDSAMQGQIAAHQARGYLVDEYQIRMLPSASVLRYLNRQHQPQASLLALGNPDLNDPAMDLPGAQREALAISDGLPGARVLLRKQATETVVKGQADAYRYLHFASHGVFEPQQPLQSGLLLSRDDKNDGVLTVAELYDLNLSADLVTLSACETALGKIMNGDDVVGFTRGFLFAGASSIVSSLWKVDDAATSALMQEFYQGMQNDDKRGALRNAQLAVKSRFSHPYFWAAFQLTGSAD